MYSAKFGSKNYKNFEARDEDLYTYFFLCPMSGMKFWKEFNDLRQRMVPNWICLKIENNLKKIMDAKYRYKTW